MGVSAGRILGLIEPLLYGPRGRRACVALLLLATLFLLARATQLQPEARYENALPTGHPYIEVFQQYQRQFGGANLLLFALLQKTEIPDIYNERFLATLRAATDEVFFAPGIDRSRVTSIFTRNVRYYEVVDGGQIAGDVVPAHYAPTPEMFTHIRENVGKAGVGGFLVSEDGKGAVIAAEVLSASPITGLPFSPTALAAHFEDQLRGRFSSPTRYLYRLKAAQPPFAAGAVVAERYSDPGWRLWFQDVVVEGEQDSAEPVQHLLRGRDLTVEAVPNPHYNPDVSVHIIGYTQLVADVTDAALQVALFFALTVLATMLALWLYLGSLRLALLPLCCSLVAVIWEFGLLEVFGYGLDPFAIMVPFLVLAVSTSHGVQYVNTWADEVAQGRDGFEASRASFRRLFIPGSIALLTNVAGFLTIYLVPIGTVRDMAVNACLGMFAVILTNKVLMPVWLSYLRVRDVDAFRERRRGRLDAGENLWKLLSRVAEPKPAALMVLLSLAVLGGSWIMQQQRVIGDTTDGAPELRPESRYNRDLAAITQNFSIGTEVLKVITVTEAESCAEYATLEQIDGFVTRMQSVEGVQSARAVTGLVKQIYSALSETNPRFLVLPRNHNILVLINQGISTQTGFLNFHCDAMPVTLYLSDHRAGTIARVIAAVKQYDELNAREFYQDHPQSTPQACAQRSLLRREHGRATLELQHHQEALRASGASDEAVEADAGTQERLARREALSAQLAESHAPCPAHFALGSGNIGVMAAANEVVQARELPIVLAVYAVIVLLMLACYRSLAGLLCICIPLFMVSIFANALMALFGIGLKVATLPVVALAVGVGVDYGIYIYDVLQEKAKQLPLREAYLATLRQTGKAVIFTGLCLAGGVAAWMFSELQFQRDMGKLLVFMFGANMLGAVLLLPAWYRLLTRQA